MGPGKFYINTIAILLMYLFPLMAGALYVFFRFKRWKYGKKTTGEIQSKVITPFDSNDENNIKKRWEIGATYFDREIDPFVEKLIKEYNIQEIEDASETKKHS